MERIRIVGNSFESKLPIIIKYVDLTLTNGSHILYNNVKQLNFVYNPMTRMNFFGISGFQDGAQVFDTYPLIEIDELFIGVRGRK